MHFARFWRSGRLENHLEIMLNLFETHVEKELRFDVFWGVCWGHFSRPEMFFGDQILKKNALKFLIRILMIFWFPPGNAARGVRSLPGGLFDT